MAKKGTSSIVLCMRKVLGSVQILCINVVITTKKVTKKVKKRKKNSHIITIFEP